jgi:hypothetical protein
VVKLKDKLISKYRSKIGEKAISRTKKRLAVSGKSATSLAKDELEIIVGQESSGLTKAVLFRSKIKLLSHF